MLRMQKCESLFRSVVVLFFIISYSAGEAVDESTTATIPTTLPPVSPCVVTDNTALCHDIENFDSLTDVRITKLVVRSQELKKIQKNDLAKFEDLKTIDISDSGVMEIDPAAFGTLANLEEINLSGNEGMKMPETLIQPKTLTHLNLSGIPITQLPGNIFTAPNLKVLDLTATNITDLTPISKLEKLTTLVISKDDRYNTTILCDHKTLKEIFIKTVDGQEEQILCEKKTEAKNAELNIEDTKLEEKQSDKTTTVVPEVVSKSEPNTTAAPVVASNSTVSKEIIEDDPSLTTEKKQDDDEVTEAATPAQSSEQLEKHEHDNKEVVEKNSSKIDVATTEKSEPPAVRKIEVAPPPVSSEETKHDKENEIIGNKAANQESNDKSQESEEVKDQATTINTADSNGTNIVLGIVLCVMIVGALGFGYRYYKNRQSGYRHANTSDNVEEGKELQTIVAHHVDPEQN